MEPLAKPEDAENGDAIHCGTALLRPVVEPLAEPDDSENGDATHCGTAMTCCGSCGTTSGTRGF